VQLASSSFCTRMPGDCLEVIQT